MEYPWRRGAWPPSPTCSGVRSVRHADESASRPLPIFWTSTRFDLRIVHPSTTGRHGRENSLRRCCRATDEAETFPSTRTSPAGVQTRSKRRSGPAASPSEAGSAPSRPAPRDRTASASSSPSFPRSGSAPPLFFPRIPIPRPRSPSRDVFSSNACLRSMKEADTPLQFKAVTGEAKQPGVNLSSPAASRSWPSGFAQAASRVSQSLAPRRYSVAAIEIAGCGCAGRPPPRSAPCRRPFVTAGICLPGDPPERPPISRHSSTPCIRPVDRR